MKKVFATICAFLAALLYSLSIPVSKLLLKDISPTMIAAFLYIGAGLGMGILSLFKIKDGGSNEPIKKKDLIYIILMVLLDISAPILMMFGLKTSIASSASLLNNFEIVATALIALLIFKEKVNVRMWIAIGLITISSFILSFEDISTFKISIGSVLILGATISWGLENNCTKMLSNKNTFHIVTIKGLGSGIGSFIIALLLKEQFLNILPLLMILLLGFVSYGLSIFLYIKAQGIIGATKTSAYYAINPFIAVGISFIIFKDNINKWFNISLIIMILATLLVIIDTFKTDNSNN